MPTKDAVEVAIGSPRCPALHDAGSRGPRQLFGLWRMPRTRGPMLPCGLARPRVSRSVAPGPRFPRIIPSLLSRYKGEGSGQLSLFLSGNEGQPPEAQAEQDESGGLRNRPGWSSAFRSADDHDALP